MSRQLSNLSASTRNIILEMEQDMSENEVQVYSEQPDGEILINTFDITSAQGKMDVLNVLNGSSSLNDVKNGTVLKVIGVITQRATRKGRNGQPDTRCINTYLKVADGKSYFSQSDGIARNITTIIGLFSDCKLSDDKPYLPLKVTTQKLNNGNTLKGLVFAE